MKPGFDRKARANRPTPQKRDDAGTAEAEAAAILAARAAGEAKAQQMDRAFAAHQAEAIDDGGDD